MTERPRTGPDSGPDRGPDRGTWDADVLRRLGPSAGSQPAEPHQPSRRARQPAEQPAERPSAGAAPRSPGEPDAITAAARHVASPVADDEDPTASPWESRTARRLSSRSGTSSWRRRFGMLAGVFRSDDEPERRTLATSRCQTAVSTGRRVVVVAAHGGAGATTLTAGLGLVLARIRNDSVAVLAGRPDRQVLQHRLGCEHPASTRAVRDLLVAHQSDPNVASLDHLAVPDAPGLRAVTESEDPTVVTQGADHLSRRHAVTLVDVGPVTDHPALRTAHGIVVVARLSLDGVAQAHQVLGELAGRVTRQRLQVVLVETGTDTGIALGTAQRLLAPHDAPVAAVPYDLHLATGTRVALDRLSDPAAIALTEIAAQALDLATART